MSLNHSLVGVPSEPWTVTWDSSAALLYALGVGAGQPDPAAELEYTTENTAGVAQRVLPTYAIVLAQRTTSRALGDFDPALLVHAEQAFSLAEELPVSGSVRVVATVTAIHDKGSGALVVTESIGTDATDERPVFSTRSSVFIRGEGGFGGERGPASTWTPPDGSPDLDVRTPTRPEQALLYRLSGDRNPLHSDPAFARRGGFERPILHGLCTYGCAGRALLQAAGDGERLVAMSGRFSAPVIPGATLRTRIWRRDSSLWFRTSTDDDTVVIDRGEAQLAGSEAADAAPGVRR